MKIMRYYEIKALGPVFPINKGRYHLNTFFNMPACQGEIIILLGSKTSSKAWLEHLFLDMKKSPKQALAGNFLNSCIIPDPEKGHQPLSPLVSLYDQVLKEINNYRTHLTSPQKINLAEHYLTAAGLQAYRELTPLQVPKIALQQAKLALRFAAGFEVILVDKIFENLDPHEKGLLHICLTNLQDSEAYPRTVIYATQNLDDALFMGDRILIMNPVKAGTLAENIPVNLDRPGNCQIFKKTPAYKNLRRQLHYLLTDALALEDYLLLG